MWVVTLVLGWSISSSFFPVPAARASGLWTELAPPDWRLGATSVYDRTHHRMIMFGGNNGLEVRNDVWVLELSYPNTWRRLQPTGTPPSARMQHMAVYDPLQDRMIVFGGGTPVGQNFLLHDDVWALELAGSPHWTQVVPAGPPPSARVEGAVVFDALRNRMLLHGGAGAGGNLLGDIWELSLAGLPSWSQMAPTTAIGPRGYASAIIDSVRDRMVIMGGAQVGGQGYQSMGDTWTAPLSSPQVWTELATIGTPPVTFGHGGVYDPLHDQMVVVGGFDSNTQTPLQGAWRLRFSTATPTWSRGPLSGPMPPPGAYSAAIYDPKADAVRIFGGWGLHPSTVSQNTWTLWLHPSPNWGEPLSIPAPPATGRYGAATAYDGTAKRMILFGGASSWYPVGTSYLNDVWTLDLTGANPFWTPLTPTGTPPEGRQHASLVYDPSGNRVVLYGGEGDGTRFPDVWSLSLTGTPAWTELTPSGTPPFGRSRHGAIYDPIRDRMVMFGGSSLNFPYYQNDTWALSLSGAPAWTALSPSGVLPSRRQDLSVALDSARDRMLMFGGLSDTAPVLNNDVWALSLAGATAWDSLEVAVGPAERRAQQVAYDTGRDRLLMFGGYVNDVTGTHGTSELWSLALTGSPAWAVLDPATVPDANAEHSGVFDPVGDRLIAYGGYGFLNGTWIYQPSAVLAAPLPLPPSGNSRISAAPNPSRGPVDLSFVLPAAGHAQVAVFDVTGRRVARLVDATLPAGPHTTRWDGRLGDRAAAAGVYIARLEHPGGVGTIRLLLIR